jgi:hypothetical protein
MLTLPNSNEEKLKIPGSGFFVLNGYAPFPSYIIGSTYVDRLSFNQTKDIDSDYLLLGIISPELIPLSNLQTRSGCYNHQSPKL